MAEKQVSIILKAVDQATSTIKGVGGSLSDFAKNNQQTFTRMAVAGTATFGAIALAVKNVVAEYQEAEKYSKRLDTIAKQVTKSTDEEIEGFKQLANQLQKVGVVGDDQIKAGQSQIASFTKSSAVVTELTDDLADLAVAQYGANVSGEQMIQTGNLLGKALQGQLGALTRTGILVSEDFAKAFEKANTEQERAVILSQIIQDNYGGLNKAMRETSAGGLVALQNSFGDLKETLGEAFIPILNKIVTAIVPIVDRFATWASENKELVAQLTMVVAGIAGVIAIFGTLGLIIPTIVAGIGAVGTALMFLTANPIGIAITIIGALIALGVLLYQNFDEIKMRAEQLGAVIELVRNKIKLIISTTITSIKTTVNTVWNSMRDGVKSSMNSVFTRIQDKFNGIISFVTNAVNKIRNLWDSAKDVVGLGGGASGKRALGGPVQSGKTYLVGERGPEMFTPAGSGSITPTNQLGGGGVNIAINMGGVVVQNEADETRLVASISESLKREMQLFRLGIN